MLLGVMTIGLAVWWWQAGPGSDSESSNPASRLAGAPDVVAGSEAMVAGAATIVDEGAGAPQVPSLVEAPRADAGSEVAMVADTAPVARDTAAGAAPQGTDNPFLIADSGAGAAATRATPRQRPSAPRRAAAAASGDEPDLLAILMGNIKPGQDAATHEGSGLDAFIRTMETEDTGMASVDENRNGRPQRARSQQIQQNLRECPAANTAKGLKCRQEICAVYAGRDPACPANG